MNKELIVFEGQEIRRHYDEATETWWFLNCRPRQVAGASRSASWLAFLGDGLGEDGQGFGAGE